MTSGKPARSLPREILELAEIIGLDPRTMQHLLMDDNTATGLALRDDYRRMLERPPRNDYLNDQYIVEQGKISPNYSQTSIKPPPENVLIQFIGGPLNAEQQYKPWREWNMRAEHVCSFIVQERITQTHPDSARGDIIFHHYNYRLTFIPMNQTPFSDAQIVVGIFQE